MIGVFGFYCELCSSTGMVKISALVLGVAKTVGRHFSALVARDTPQKLGVNLETKVTPVAVFTDSNYRAHGVQFYERCEAIWDRLTWDNQRLSFRGGGKAVPLLSCRQITRGYIRS